MKKQIRTTKTIEVFPEDHKDFSMVCIEKDLTQAQLFEQVWEDWRANQ